MLRNTFFVKLILYKLRSESKHHLGCKGNNRVKVLSTQEFEEALD